MNHGLFHTPPFKNQRNGPTQQQRKTTKLRKLSKFNPNIIYFYCYAQLYFICFSQIFRGQMVKKHRLWKATVGLGQEMPAAERATNSLYLILLLLLLLLFLLLLLLLHGPPHSDDFCHFALVAQPERSPSSAYQKPGLH